MRTRQGSQLSVRRAAGVVLSLALATTVLAWAPPSSAQAATTCSWGGTPAAPTGWFTVTPGVTNAPAPQALKFVATGQLAGADTRCRGEMKWVGQVDAGSTCTVASFEGTVTGLPGVTHFWGKGSLLVPSYLYDRSGNVVGVENAEIMTQHNLPLAASCAAPGGFTGPADFSSTVVLF